MMEALQTLVFAWLALLAMVTARALWCTYLAQPPSHKSPAHGAASLDPYILVRICGGAEPHLLSNLLSVQKAVGAAPAHVWLVVPQDDPQRLLVQEAQRRLEAAGLRSTVVTTCVAGANHKVAQLAATAHCGSAHGDVVYADGDVDLTHYPMDALRTPLQVPGCAAAWAPCAERPAPHNAPSAALLTTSLHCFALLGRIDPRSMVGKLWATRKCAIASVGGWASLVDVLGEDMELARRFAQLGRHTTMVQANAWTRPAPRGFAAAVARYARWFWVIRAQRPHLLASYPALFFGTTGLLALCAVDAAAHPQAAASIAASALVLRLGVSIAARHALAIPPTRLLRDTLWSEIITLTAFVCMLAQNNIRWRHQHLRVRRGGRITAQPTC